MCCVCRTEGCSALAERGVFAYGCSFDEHVKYGMCVDGLCSRRASWEHVSVNYSGGCLNGCLTYGWILTVICCCFVAVLALCR